KAKFFCQEVLISPISIPPAGHKSLTSKIVFLFLIFLAKIIGSPIVIGPDEEIQTSYFNVMANHIETNANLTALKTLLLIENLFESPEFITITLIPIIDRLDINLVTAISDLS